MGKKTHMPNFMRIRSEGGELFHSNRQTDRHDEANSRFSQFREKRLKVCNCFNIFIL